MNPGIEFAKAECRSVAGADPIITRDPVIRYDAGAVGVRKTAADTYYFFPVVNLLPVQGALQVADDQGVRDVGVVRSEELVQRLDDLLDDL